MDIFPGWNEIGLDVKALMGVLQLVYMGFAYMVFCKSRVLKKMAWPGRLFIFLSSSFFVAICLLLSMFIYDWTELLK